MMKWIFSGTLEKDKHFGQYQWNDCKQNKNIRNIKKKQRFYKKKYGELSGKSGKSRKSKVGHANAKPDLDIGKKVNGEFGDGVGINKDALKYKSKEHGDHELEFGDVVERNN